MNTPTGILILAAGNSSRLGYPKQLIDWEGKSLLQRSVSAALEAGADHVGVVLGARKSTMEKEIDSWPVHLFYNEGWVKGIGSSIKAGLSQFVEKLPDLKALLIMLCDQPYVDSSLLQKILQTYKSTSGQIIACHYEDTLGVPALFDKKLFSALLQIPDHKGAKPIIEANRQLVNPIEFPHGNIDIDTENDLNKLKQNKGGIR